MYVITYACCRFNYGFASKRGLCLNWVLVSYSDMYYSLSWVNSKLRNKIIARFCTVIPDQGQTSGPRHLCQVYPLTVLDLFHSRCRSSITIYHSFRRHNSIQFYLIWNSHSYIKDVDSFECTLITLRMIKHKYIILPTITWTKTLLSFHTGKW